MPRTRDDHSCTVSDGKMYIFGGFVAGTRTHELHSFDFTTNEWSELAKECTDGPKKRAGSTLVSHNGELFVFGGHNEINERLNELWSYNISSDKWQQIEHSGEIFPHVIIRFKVILGKKWTYSNRDQWNDGYFWRNP
jgi:N-acetylneuraminic acid mutarotase